MAVKAQFIGRLGADAEVKTSKNGSQFLSMRVATDEFNNGVKGTAWLTVMYPGERAMKMKEWLTKGKLVSVFGTERVSLYDNRNGEKVISRDVMADCVDFVSVGGKQEGQQETTAQPVSESVTPFKKPDEPFDAVPVSPMATFPPTTPSDDIDDLPF